MQHLHPACRHLALMRHRFAEQTALVLREEVQQRLDERVAGFGEAIARQARLEDLLVDVVLVGLWLTDREQDFTQQQEVLRHLRDQIAIDRIEQPNAGECFHAAKRCVVDVNDPNATVPVNELLHGNELGLLYSGLVEVVIRLFKVRTLWHAVFHLSA